MNTTIEEIRSIDPRNRTEEQWKIVHEFHDKALVEFYQSWGVGNSDEHKAKFWDKYMPNTYVSHVDPGSSQWVKAMELWWITDTFPEDAIFC